MEYRIIWSGPAQRALDQIIEKVARDYPSAASRLQQRIVRKIDLLASSPFLGSVYPPGSGSVARETREGSYRVFYQVNVSKQQVEILAVWHAARQEPKLPLDE
jgi:plasmid stabilization system protein ParE